MWRDELAGLTLTILLYLGGEPDLVRIVHPSEKPLKAKILYGNPNSSSSQIMRSERDCKMINSDRVHPPDDSNRRCHDRN